MPTLSLYYQNSLAGFLDGFDPVGLDGFPSIQGAACPMFSEVL